MIDIEYLQGWSITAALGSSWNGTRSGRIPSCSLSISGQVYCLTIWLLSSRVVIVKLATQEVEPFFQIQDFVIHKVTGSSFDHEDFLVGQVLCQPAGNHASCGTTANNEIVKRIHL